MCLTLAYAASLGGAATPIGTGPNVIAISMFDELLGVHVDFGQWMAIAVPTTLALLVVTISITHRRFPAPVAEVSQLRAEIRKQLEQLGTMSAAEWKVVVVFALAICGWLGPSLVKLALGAQHPSLGWARTHLDEGVVAIVATGCLFFMRGSTDERGDVHRLLAPDDVQQVDWGTLLLLGGGMALGSLTFSTGLAAAIGEGIVDLTGDLARHPLGLAAAASLLVLFLTEVTSNTATVSMMLPVLLGVAAASGVDPLPTGIAVTLAGSFAFMLPVSTPPNAIAYGTKMIRIDDMIRTGFKLDLVGYVVLLLAAAFLIPAVI
jgi:sodium-dependent dicarboxylate transporter 2/3/5